MLYVVDKFANEIVFILNYEFQFMDMVLEGMSVVVHGNEVELFIQCSVLIRYPIEFRN